MKGHYIKDGRFLFAKVYKAAARVNGRMLYVSELRGHGGKDWGYTPYADQSAILSERMAKIFVGENIPGRHIWEA